MKYLVTLLCLLLSPALYAGCLFLPDITLGEQLSWTHKATSLWRIHGNKVYTTDNAYNNLAMHASKSCMFTEHRLEFSYSFYAMAYQSLQPVGSFETDRHRARLLLDQFTLAYNLTDALRLEGGKLNTLPGAFFLKSPADLLLNDSAAFKPTRIYDTALRQVYEESSWGGKISVDTPDYALAFTAVPKLAHIDKRYLSSGNWHALQRSNASDRYVLSWTDNRSTRHIPSLALRLGDSPSLALADAFNVTPQWVINAELAFHSQQQWRHFSEDAAQRVRTYDFPSSLYRLENKRGGELAVGGQYTTDNLSMAGLEYYFQSEGYSREAWRRQTDFIQYLTERTGYAPLDLAFDNYQYLMGSEISNTANKGMLQSKHYLNAYASVRLTDKSSLQPWVTLNLQDGSVLMGAHYQTPLEKISDKLEGWSGLYTAQGRQDSEFALFGSVLGIYLGIKYYL